MDRSAQNRSFSASSFRSPLISKERSSIFSPNRLASPNYIKKSSSRYSAVTGRSNQSVQAVCKTSYHVVERFGVALPVQVTEALTFADRSSSVTVHITTDGWAWFVCGRRLLIWQCKLVLDPASQRHRSFTPINSQCRELKLPPSDLAHRGELVSVYLSQGNNVPSCIAVSPEGSVRYWPSISHEDSCIEENTDLQGQECDSLTNIGPIGCILATTTSTIVLVQTEVSGGRHVIQCRTIKTPQGWLGGFGKKMSSLIFGGLPSSQGIESKLVKVVTVDGRSFDSDDWRMYVLGERSIQKWLLALGDIERLIYEVDITQMVKDAFYESVWEASAGDRSELDVWMLDMQPVEGGVMILCAAVYMPVSPQLHYALGTICTETANVPTRFSSFVPLKFTGFYRQQDEAQLLGYKFVLLQQEAYLFNKKMVVIVSTSQPGDEPDTVEFATPGDMLLGGGLCGNIPAFFTKNNGFVSITPSDLQPGDLLNASAASFADATSPGSFFADVEDGFTAAVTDTELEELTLNKDKRSRLKGAFIFYVKKQTQQSHSIVAELFPHEAIRTMDVDTLLDTVAVCVGKDLVNDMPAGDPRWADMKMAAAGSIGSSMSLQILQQLEDKLRALELYFSFLKDLKLWERLSAVTVRNSVMATTYVLCELAEKVVSAIAFRTLQSDHGAIIETGIKSVLEKQKVTPVAGLTHNDLFYRKVTQVHELIQVLTQWSTKMVHTDRSPQDVATQLAQVNTIILTVLQEVIQYRQQKAELFSPTTLLSPGIGEYLPWTAAPGKEGLTESLMMQQSLTLKHGAKATGDAVLKNQLYEQQVHLLDIILDGQKCHLESIRGTDKFDVLYQKYETERHAIIEPFLDAHEYERAAVLAEKYCDFRILVQICELTNNKARLDKYMERFSDQDFSKFVFNWYIGENKHGKLLSQFGHHKNMPTQQKALSKFLGDHPSLSWLQNVFAGEFKQASQTLLDLAKDETELLGRKRTMLSLAKLALLASDEDNGSEDALEEFNNELDLIRHQEDLPETVLTAYGYDTDRLRVLTPTELVKLFISEENVTASEYDFQKALDLLKYVDDEFERSELKHNIWCQAILRDSWMEGGTDSPLKVIEKFVFFKLVDLINFMGGNAIDVLPPIDRLLTAPELGELTNNKTFQYLLKSGYEHVQHELIDL